MDLAEARKIGGSEGHQQPYRPPGQSEPDQSARPGEQSAFGQKIACNAQSSRAQCAADCDFPLACLGSDKEQICDVRAGDQQHQTNRTKQNPQRVCDASDDGFLDRSRFGPEPQVVNEPRNRPVVRIGPRQVGDQAVQLGAGARHVGARTKSRDARVHEGVPDRLSPHLLGNPDVDTRIGESKERRHHADDLGWGAAQRDRSRKYRRIAAVSTLPEAIRQNRDLRGIRRHARRCVRRLCAFVLREPAAIGRPRLQHRRERRRYARNPDSFRLAAVGQRLLVGAVERNALERPGAIQIFIEQARRHLDARRHVPAVRRPAMVQVDHAVGVRIGEWGQQHTLHDGENRRVSANGQRQRQHSGERERRTPGQARAPHVEGPWPS